MKYLLYIYNILHIYLLYIYIYIYIYCILIVYIYIYILHIYIYIYIYIKDLQESKYNEILNVKAFSNIKAYKATIYMSFLPMLPLRSCSSTIRTKKRKMKSWFLSHKYLTLFSYIQGSSLV